MRAALVLAACLWLGGCMLFGGGGGGGSSPGRETPKSQPPRDPGPPLHPELVRSQSLIDQAAANPTVSSQFNEELGGARAQLDQAVAIWKAEKGKLDEDDEEWQELQHLNYLARQRTALVVMKARGLDAQRQLAELQSRHRTALGQKPRRQAVPAKPAPLPTLPAQLQDLRPRQEPRGLVLTLNERQFEPGQAVLVNGEALLDALMEYLIANPGKSVACEGYSDSQEGEASGQRLSQQRARAVQQALLERGLEFSRITAVGYGSSRPLVSDGVMLGNSTRVEIVISDGAPASY
jgi:outer membrane protein OmpA-like peptidoglycan-associated protein